MLVWGRYEKGLREEVVDEMARDKLEMVSS